MKRRLALSLALLSALVGILYAATAPTSSPTHRNMGQNEILGHIADNLQTAGVATLPTASPAHRNLSTNELLGYIADYSQSVGTVGHGGTTPTPNWVTVTATEATETFSTVAAHGLVAGNPVIFKTTSALPTLTGTDYFEDATYGPIATLEPGRLYYVATVPTTSSFTLYYYATGGPVSIANTGTGTHSVNLATRGDMTIGVDGAGAIQAHAADSTANGGNTRGYYAVDFQRARESATQVAAADYSTILNGINNKISYTALQGSVYGNGSTILGGRNNHILNGNSSVLGGQHNTMTGTNSAFAFGERFNVYTGSGQGFTAFGSQHLGGGQDSFFGGGFHNLINGFGTTDLDLTGTVNGAVIGAVGDGTYLTGSGGFNMQALGAGVHAYWQGCEFRTNHGNKDKAMIRGNLVMDSASYLGVIAVGAPAARTDELFLMGYYPASVVVQSTGVNTGNGFLTASSALANTTQVRLTSTDALPAGYAVDTTYFVVQATGLTYKLSLTSGGTAIIPTTVGTGILHVMSTWVSTSSAARWLRLFPSKIYTFDFTVVSTLKSATTPTYAVWRRRASYIQGSTIPSEPTLIGAVATVGTDVGSNAGAPPVGWSVNLTTGTDGLHVSVTIENNDGASRNHHTTAAFECVEISTP